MQPLWNGKPDLNDWYVRECYGFMNFRCLKHNHTQMEIIYFSLSTKNADFQSAHFPKASQWEQITGLQHLSKDESKCHSKPHTSTKRLELTFQSRF